MKTRMHLAYLLMISVSMALTFSGCSKENATEPINTSVSATSDAAESIASGIGENTGGALDQIGDLLSLASPAEYNSLAKDLGTDQLESREATYDPSTGIWTVVLERERGSLTGTYYALIKRTYTYQFLNQAGVPQEHWISNGDTARTILFQVVDAEGRHITPRISQALKSLQASLTATNCHTPLITVNGIYARAAVDTISTERLQRTHDHELNLTLTNVTGPRGSRKDLSQKVSGTITGTYHAFITFSKGDAYSEREITREISIDLSNGTGELHLGSTKFGLDLYWGMTKSN